MSFRKLALTLIALLFSRIDPARAGTDPSSRPNIVLIISDDHAWTDYGFMGHEHIRTPNLDRLAAQSVLYRRGYVPSSLCCPSLASMITGLYPHQHKITCNDPPTPPGKPAREHPEFAAGREVMNHHLEAVPTLPRILAEHGYLSLQTGKWWQGDYRRGGFTHGMTRGERHGDAGLDIGRKTMQPIFDFIAESRARNKPFFVWYAPMMPHDPHNPPQRLLEQYATKTDSPFVAKYWAMVQWFDESCGQLLDHLDQQGLGENTIVLYVADNGWIQNPAGPRFAPKSKQSPYDGGLRTPIMVRWRGRVAPHGSDRLASSVDLAPTILAALGIDRTADMQGVNLLDTNSMANRTEIHGACFVHTAIDLKNPARNLSQRWIVSDRWKLIAPATRNGPAAVELYDVLADPFETANLAANHPEHVTRLLYQLDQWWDPNGNPRRIDE